MTFMQLTAISELSRQSKIALVGYMSIAIVRSVCTSLWNIMVLWFQDLSHVQMHSLWPYYEEQIHPSSLNVIKLHILLLI